MAKIVETTAALQVAGRGDRDGAMAKTPSTHTKKSESRKPRSSPEPTLPISEVEITPETVLKVASIQSGVAQVVGDGEGIVRFPRPFSGTPSVVVTAVRGNLPAEVIIDLQSITSAHFTVLARTRMGQEVHAVFHWIAIGS